MWTQILQIQKQTTAMLIQQLETVSTPPHIQQTAMYTTLSRRTEGRTIGTSMENTISRMTRWVIHFIFNNLADDEPQIERERLDLQHHMCRLSFGSLYLAPIDNLEGGLQQVLDIATGTGIWAIEFAEHFPQAVIKGTDLSPIQPDYVPPNCHFEVDDAEDSWVYSHKFDYIHGRMLVTCFQSHLAVFKSAFDSLRPGGYIELQDASFPFMGADEKWEGTAFQRWWRMLMDASRALGKDWNRVPRYKGYLEELGFVDVVERRFPCPIGPWAKGEKNKILGVWARANMLQSVGGLSMAILTRGLGMTAAEIEVLLVDVRNDINKNGAESIHVYAPL